MWECNYGKEPLDIRLLMLRLLRKSPWILLAAILGALCVGGPYFLRKVTFGPAKEYEAVTDFYIDYAVQENGEQYTYINQTTWTQLITDDVFTDKILTHMSETTLGENGWNASLQEKENASGVTKRQLRDYLYATMLSDTRIVTTTVTTNEPALTMKIERALILAMQEFGEEQKEIAGVRILQEPAEASLVIADVRTFRACMLGAVVFTFVTAFYLLLYFVLDEGIHIPAAFERRYGIPMLGTLHSPELKIVAKKLFTEQPALVTADKGIDLEQAKELLAAKGIETKIAQGETEKELLLVVKAGAHNGKQMEKTMGFYQKCGQKITAALLWEADEKLIKVYEMPEHMLHAWHRKEE